MTDLRTEIAALVHDVPDHPRPGVTFKDITPVLADAAAFARVVDHMVQAAPGPVDVVVGMEARGFILGAPVAVALGAGFVPVRKEGKLPRATLSGSYDLEYGSAVLEVHPDTVPDGARVLVVDDVLATGGTAAATVELLEQAGGQVVGLSFLMELDFLHGRSRLEGRDVQALLRY
ncbi:adenine phosphoribosyltransferase [Cellulomonas bogoriensis]|uniref:Adenine phosphoribosyltransferase n=1 Tax=Cellulomonas bogoriensis 69B4 = DSM 16987 TaxID=1386082 RepID=A0A0A0BV33_9CELL|nr:adenine phosphoribosyltransferase [Cellulomonas bogoriensis]KGM11756.1 adenine phosphoribosyltransferase [Cellulomonas bogoriensis 69B4 = DSM 16987]